MVPQPTILRSSRLENAVEILTNLITSGRLGPGAALPSEAQLCRELNISRSTVREALRTLETRGLIVSRHGVGAIVIDRTSQVAAQSILLMLKHKGVGPSDMLEARLLLECHVAALAAERASDDDLALIASAIDAMRHQPRSAEDNVQLDFDFHLRVAEASHNLVLMTLVDAIRDLLFQTIAATHAIDPRIESRVEVHSQILRAIESRDPDGASAAMRKHLKMTEYLVELARSTAASELEKEDTRERQGSDRPDQLDTPVRRGVGTRKETEMRA
jgi:GntR family transcriptional repressor for pyruvate dehydrogenase complex